MSTLRATYALMVVLLLVCPATAGAAPDPSDYFKIAVVDDETGRGVPLVELKTTHEVRYYTDSNGIVAFYEPGLMDQEVYFYIKSHGYEFPPDGFGYRGKALRVTRGGSAQLKIRRLNIAERLYRVTGEGIYRDSSLVGHPVPIEHPRLNGQVTGQDSVLATPYRGKLYWFWGDTNRPAYPLGNFGVSGATSEWPRSRGGQGGLDPSTGVDLQYFVNESGFSRAMIPSQAIAGPGPKWIGGLATIADENGTERLVAKYERIKSLGEPYERGLVIFNDQTESFERLVQFDLKAPLYLDGHPFRATVDGQEYLHGAFSVPYAVRVRADRKHVTDPTAYEGFTCLVAGTRYDKSSCQLDRTSEGRLRYAWKANTPPLSTDQQNELIAAGKMRRPEAWLQLEDIDTGNPIKPHAGSVCWNEFRQRWVMIMQQAFGTSAFGEVWYAEADTAVGPWVYTKKIVTHDKYTFYNPTQHPFFDSDGARLIYFEGTYSDLFSGSPERTPRYDYNQIMYRLELDDARLFLPAPVYRVKGVDGAKRYLLREGIEAEDAWDRIEDIAFFAVPANRRREGLIPVYAEVQKDGVVLQREPPAGGEDSAQPLFYAMPTAPTARQEKVAGTSAIVPLYEYRRANGGTPLYSTASELNDKTWKRAAEPICRVWRNPMALLILDPQTRPVPLARK